MESAPQSDRADDGPTGAGRGDVLRGIFRGAADGGSDLVVWESSRRNNLKFTNQPRGAFHRVSRRRPLRARGFAAVRTDDGPGRRPAGRGPLAARTRRRAQPAAHHGWTALAGGLRSRGRWSNLSD